MLAPEKGERMSGKLVVQKGYFESREAALEDIRDTGFWPTTFVSEKSPELPIHYHDHDVIGYAMEGETYLLDEDGRRIPIGPGDRLLLPRGCWHAEGEVTGRMVYLVTLSEPIPLMEGLAPREPQGPFPGFDR